MVDCSSGETESFSVGTPNKATANARGRFLFLYPRRPILGRSSRVADERFCQKKAMGPDRGSLDGVDHGRVDRLGHSVHGPQRPDEGTDRETSLAGPNLAGNRYHTARRSRGKWSG